MRAKFLAMVMPIAAMASAANFCRGSAFMSGAGDWASGSNWSSGAVPSVPDNATGPDGAVATIDSAVPTVADVRWANVSNSAATINVLPGGSLTVDSSGAGFLIGRADGATGTVNMSGGSITTLANSAGTSGTFTIGSITNASGSATGIFNISGGTVAVGANFYLGASSNLAPNGGGPSVNPPTSFTMGTVTQTGGAITSAATVQVGEQGIGVYNMSGGSLSETGVAGTGTVNRDAFFVGRDAYSTGTFSQSGTASVSVSNSLYISDGNYTSGSYTISGGSLSIDGEIRVAPSLSDLNVAIVNDTGALTIIGDSASTITANSLMADTAGSTLGFSINSSAGTSLLDLTAGSAGGITFIGNAVFSASTQIDVDNIAGYMPAPGQSFVLLTAAGGINMLPTLVGSDAFNSATLSIVANNDGSSSLVVTTVPEPRSIFVLLVGGLTFFGRRRSQSNKETE